MSYIGFMRNTVSHIEKLFNKYMENSKSYPSSLEKEDYKNQMERIHRYGEIEDEKEYKKLMKRLKEHDLTTVVELRKAIK